MFMKKLFGLMIVFSAAAVAQGPDFFQAPGAVQVRELNRPFVGGTYLGVNLAEIDANRAKELKLKEDYGVEISRVEENSPAEKAGVKTGDVVLEYNGQRVEGMEQFGRMVRETPPGREAKLTISRNGAVQTLTAVLGLRKFPFSGNFPPGFEVPEFHMPDIPQIFTTIRSPMLGVEAESLGTQLAVYFGVKEGVLVRSVLENTPAQKAGIKAGDVITESGRNGSERAQRIIECGKSGERQEDLRDRAGAGSQAGDGERERGGSLRTMDSARTHGSKQRHELTSLEL